MATKVKGEAIKEGSIPLSALSTEIKDKIENAGGNSDWAAQEGETGYINRRTHYIYGARAIPLEQWDKKYDTDGYAIYSHYIGTDYDTACLIQKGRWDILEENYIFFRTEWKSLIPTSTADIRINYDFESGRSVLEIKIDEQIEDISNMFNNVLFAYGYNEEFIHKIANEFLPNTIIKTTPQTLSDSAKNQALANLGIDPVIWKYMCNPHIVEYESDSGSCSNPIPKELSDIIYQNGKFNHFILSTVLIKIYIRPEESDMYYKVERITSYTEHGNVIFDNLEFGYDTETRLFVV